jgi:very-short-patch-repair endonuclease
VWARPDAATMAVRPGSFAPLAPPALPAIHLAGDHTSQDVARQVRSGAWRRVGRGAYLPAGSEATARRTALARIVAVHHRLTAPHVFGHDSAALLWVLPLWALPNVVHVYQCNRPGARRDPAVRRHIGIPVAAAVTLVEGLPVTTLALTAVDCARAMAPRAALVVVDAALRAGASLDEMTQLLARDPAGRGSARARQVVVLGDAGAESPRESALRFVLLRAGLPQPETQVRIDTHLGAFWADLGWEQWRVALEYDGRQKYADPEALVREKRRHDALVEAGWSVILVTKEDLARPDLLVARVERLLPRDVPRTRRPHLRAT